LLPEKPGYSIEIFPETLRDYSYPMAASGEDE